VILRNLKVGLIYNYYYNHFQIIRPRVVVLTAVMILFIEGVSGSSEGPFVLFAPLTAS